MKCAKSKSTTALVLKASLSSCIKDLKRPAHKKAVVLGTLRRLLIELSSSRSEGYLRAAKASTTTEVDRKVAF